MINSNCLKHSEDCHRVVLLEDYIAITTTKAAAAILFYFEKRTNRNIDQIRDNVQNDNYMPNKNELGMQCSNKYLRKVMMQEFSENSIRGALIELESFNLISSRRNIASSNGDAATSYFLNTEETQSKIDNYNLEKYTPSSKLSTPLKQSAKLSTPYAELSTPPSKLSTTNNIRNSISSNRIINNSINYNISENEIEEKNETPQTVEIPPLEVFEKKEKNAAQKEKAKSNLEAKTIEAKKLIQIINEKFQTKYRVEVISNLGIAVNALREYSFAEIETVIDNIYRFNALGNTAQYSSAPKDIFNLRTIEAKLNLKIQQKNQNNGSQTNRQNPTIGHNDLQRINGIVVTQELQEQAIRIAQAQRAKRGL